MEEISNQVKNMQLINKRKELVRSFLTAEKDEECEEVGHLKKEKDKQAQHSVLEQLLVRDEDFKYEDDAETGKRPSDQSTASPQRMSNQACAKVINEAILKQPLPLLLREHCDMFLNLKDEGEITKAFQAIKFTGPYLYCYAELDREASRKCCSEILTEKYNEYMKNPTQIPDLSTLIFFNLALSVYPTFLVSHPVTKSCLTFMSEIITSCRFENVYSISRGLFVCTLISEYTCVSNKSYVPAAVNFLRGILFLSTKLNTIEPMPPFDLNKDTKILLLEEDCSKLDVGMKTSVLDLLKDSIDNGFKIRTLLITVILLERFFPNLNDMEAQESIYEDHIQLLNSLKLELYPERVSTAVERIVKYMKGT